MLGDKYVMKEFKDTRAVTDPKVLKQFRGAWEGYVAQLRTQNSSFGKELDPDAIGAMSDDQRNKLIDLRQSTAKTEV